MNGFFNGHTRRTFMYSEGNVCFANDNVVQISVVFVRVMKNYRKEVWKTIEVDKIDNNCLRKLMKIQKWKKKIIKII